MFEGKDVKVHGGKRYGLYRGYVFDNKDPKNLGRIKFCCPSVYGVDANGTPLVSDWAYPKFPVSGQGWGIQYIPPCKNPDGSNVLVWIEFEMGDPECPVWSGCPVALNGLQTDLSGNQKLVNAGASTSYMLSISTPNGNKILLDDKNGYVKINNTTFSLNGDNFNAILANHEQRLKNGGL